MCSCRAWCGTLRRDGGKARPWVWVHLDGSAWCCMPSTKAWRASYWWPPFFLLLEFTLCSPSLLLSPQYWPSHPFSLPFTHFLSLSFSFFFLWGDFLAPASGESWDRLRLTCSQPFTRQQSFGLAFLRVCSSLDSLDDPVRAPSAPESSRLSQVCTILEQGLRIFLPFFSISG